MRERFSSPNVPTRIVSFDDVLDIASMEIHMVVLSAKRDSILAFSWSCSSLTIGTFKSRNAASAAL
jgi:hypothetical protein